MMEPFFTTSGVWLALLAFCAGGNIALGIMYHFELDKSGTVHFVLASVLLLFVVVHPLFGVGS